MGDANDSHANALPMPQHAIPPQRLGRRVVGMSAVLLPFRTESFEPSAAAAAIDWYGFESHLQRTAGTGLIPAINMDTGFGPQLDREVRIAVLERTVETIGTGEFVGGVVVVDRPGAPFDLDAYCREADEVVERGGTPIFFPSYGLTAGEDGDILARFERLADRYDTFLAFELGTMFAPFGRIFSLDLFRRLLAIPQCIGAKHSSLDRIAEWERLRLRDELRPDFRLLTGNDLAIDMVRWGSDYLLGLSTFHPEAFAQRDRWWLEQDPRVFRLDDLLQYLGAFAFRDPVPAYKHSAAMFLKLAGHLESDATFPGSPTRPTSDRPILAAILEELELLLGS